MADPKPPAEPVRQSILGFLFPSILTNKIQAAAAGAAAPSATASASATSGASSAAAKAAKPAGNPALRMLGLPMLPKKLPSRNWMIFWAITTSLSAAIIYDKREKKRATAKWARAVSHLAQEPLKNPNELPRKITVFLESPPGDGLRVAQDHFIEYVKPILHASGIDWEFVQGRQQGDVRAAVAEKIRRQRKAHERPEEDILPTNDKAILESRERSGIPEYDGIKGDLVVGRHTWKEYIRGLHEGWLGPLDPPALPEAPSAPEPVQPPPVEVLTQEPKEESKTDGGAEAKKEEPEKKEEEKKEEDKKPKRPPQPPPYNTTADYESSSIPLRIPHEFNPSAPIEFPHVLGFSNTLTRFKWFLNRRKLADNIGREVAAVCFAVSRDWPEDASGEYPQVHALEQEERNWVKSVWKDDPEEKKDDKKNEETKSEPQRPKEKIWPTAIVTDPRIMSRMRRFELLPEDEARSKDVVVPEEEIEGWIKGSFRQLFRWGASQWQGKHFTPNVGDISNEE